MSLIALHEVCLLWHECHSHVEIVCLADDAQHQFDVVYVVGVFREAAQVIVKIAVDRILEACKIAVPPAVDGTQVAEIVFAEVAEVECGAVALGVFVLKLIAEL